VNDDSQNSTETDTLLPDVFRKISRAETWFDRSVCPEPCDSMHYRCRDCGLAVDGCSFEKDGVPPCAH
jgi:hypothetical protein